jgi:hypothetical protein
MSLTDPDPPLGALLGGGGGSLRVVEGGETLPSTTSKTVLQLGFGQRILRPRRAESI